MIPTAYLVGCAVGGGFEFPAQAPLVDEYAVGQEIVDCNG